MVRFVKGQIICQLTNNLSFCQFPRPEGYVNESVIQQGKHLLSTISKIESKPNQSLSKSNFVWLNHPVDVLLLFCSNSQGEWWWRIHVRGKMESF